METRWWIFTAAVYLIFAVLFAGAFFSHANNDEDVKRNDRVVAAITLLGGLFWLPLLVFGAGSALFGRRKDKEREKQE